MRRFTRCYEIHASYDTLDTVANFWHLLAKHPADVLKSGRHPWVLFEFA
jgi:hypothetical protein